MTPRTWRRRAAVAGVIGLSAVLLASGGPARSSTPAPLTMGTVTSPGGAWQTLPVDGLNRRFVLATPDDTSEPLPLIILLHGLDQSTDPFLATTQVIAAARAAGVVVAAPETPNAAWNDGRFGSNGRNDDAFVMAIIHSLSASGIVDPTRVTVSGFSNGAGMAMEVASRHPDAVAAMVSVCGTLLAPGPDSPRPHAPVESVFLHGDHDSIQPWAGRRRRGNKFPAQIAEPQTVAAFRDAAGLTGPADTTVLPTLPGSETGAVTEYSWPNYEGGPSVTLYRVRGGNHSWFAMPDDAGPDNQATDVDATQVLVDTAVSAHLPFAVVAPPAALAI